MSPFACCSLVALLAAASAAPPANAPADPAKELARVLSKWHRGYVSGKLDLNALAREKGKTLSMYGRALPPRHPAKLTHQQALGQLMQEAQKLQTPDVARSMLVLASVGLDDKNWDFDRAPYAIRRVARQSLAKFTDTTALDTVRRTAEGRREGWKSGDFTLAVQAAALRTLAANGRSVFRPAIDAQLAHADAVVRLAAAEAVKELGHARSVDAVRLQLNAETEPTIAQLLVESLDRILHTHHTTIGAATTRRAMSTAIDAIGRTDWRTDHAIVELCARFRTTMAVEPLIGILQRFVDRRDDVGTGTLSGLLRNRTYEVLKSLTGALIPIDQPAQWRAFWERERATFRLANPKDAAPDDRRTTTAFFGIPVSGSRVLFLIDTSGSMRVPYRPFDEPNTRDRDRDAATRLEWAKRELGRAVDALPSDTQFNVIAFSSEVKRWREKPVPASPRTRKALHQRLRRLNADGGTNIFGALRYALRLKGIRHGARYEATVDEIFLLSDGEPSVGEITIPNEILELITETNRFGRVRIHTIYMGGADSWFMKRLAEQNGGRYVRL